MIAISMVNPKYFINPNLCTDFWRQQGLTRIPPEAGPLWYSRDSVSRFQCVIGSKSQNPNERALDFLHPTASLSISGPRPLLEIVPKPDRTFGASSSRSHLPVELDPSGSKADPETHETTIDFVHRLTFYESTGRDYKTMVVSCIS